MSFVGASISSTDIADWQGPVGSAIAWNGSGRSLKLTNGQIVSDVQAISPAGNIHLGSQGGSSNFLNGYLQRITVFPSRTSDNNLNIALGTPTVGSAGPANTIYSGMTLAYEDDFSSSLNIVGPSVPYGTYFTTRSYGPGPRGTTSVLGTLYDTDPQHTGYFDANRGSTLPFTNMSEANGYLTLQARKATTAEQALFDPTASSTNGGVRDQVGAMIDTAGSEIYYPSSTIIIEAKVNFGNRTTNPAGWHPTFWSYSIGPLADNTGQHDEWDLAESNSSSSYLNRNVWNAGNTSSTTWGTTNNVMDGNDHVLTLIMRNGSNVQAYLDDSLLAVDNVNANTTNEPAFMLMTAHIYNANFNGDTYNQAAWDASPNGASIKVDWMKVWRASSTPNIAPLTSVPDLDLAYNASGTIVLPSESSLWGDSSVSEYVTFIPGEANDPGMTDTSTFAQFPVGISYSTTTRTIMADFTSGTGHAGRLFGVVYGYKTNGSTGAPLRFTINRGPHITTVATLTATHGTAFSHDFYTECDVGSITLKTINVTGLPSGITFDGVSTASGTPLSPGTSTLRFPAPTMLAKLRVRQ